MGTAPCTPVLGWVRTKGCTDGPAGLVGRIDTVLTGEQLGGQRDTGRYAGPQPLFSKDGPGPSMNPRAGAPLDWELLGRPGGGNLAGTPPDSSPPGLQTPRAPFHWSLRILLPRWQAVGTLGAWQAAEMWPAPPLRGRRRKCRVRGRGRCRMGSQGHWSLLTGDLGDDPAPPPAQLHPSPPRPLLVPGPAVPWLPGDPGLELLWAARYLAGPRGVGGRGAILASARTRGALWAGGAGAAPGSTVLGSSSPPMGRMLEELEQAATLSPTSSWAVPDQVGRAKSCCGPPGFRLPKGLQGGRGAEMWK